MTCGVNISKSDTIKITKHVYEYSNSIVNEILLIIKTRQGTPPGFDFISLNL